MMDWTPENDEDLLGFPEAGKKFCGFQITGLETKSHGLPRFESRAAIRLAS
jgi:hypothetical protein